MKRIAVIGCCGAGKSTFSRQLHRITGLPLIHLDQLFWNTDWVPCGKEAFQKRSAAVYSGPAWIMDGNYLSTMKDRLALADTVIFLDYSTWTCVARVARRTLSYYGRTRPDMTAGCPERFDWDFCRHLFNFRRNHRPRILEVLAGFPGVRQLHAHNPAEAADILEMISRDSPRISTVTVAGKP